MFCFHFTADSTRLNYVTLYLMCWCVTWAQALSFCHCECLVVHRAWFHTSYFKSSLSSCGGFGKSTSPTKIRKGTMEARSSFICLSRVLRPAAAGLPCTTACLDACRPATLFWPRPCTKCCVLWIMVLTRPVHQPQNTHFQFISSHDTNCAFWQAALVIYGVPSFCRIAFVEVKIIYM